MLSDAHLCDFQELLFPTSAFEKYKVVPDLPGVCKGLSEGARVNKQGN